MNQAKLKVPVFIIPLLLLLFAVVYSLTETEAFLREVTYLNDWILYYFGRLYSVATLLFLILCVSIYISPLGKVTIGGRGTPPLLNRLEWFSVTLCTTIAIGILFWASAEPLYHLHLPPVGVGIAPDSDAAAIFALSTMFMHWTFTPYGIYTLAAVIFALAYYNMGQKFSLGSLLYPLLGKPVSPRLSDLIDAICLYSLVAGMAASLGAGILTMSGGINRFFDLPSGPYTLLAICILIVGSFILSSISGLLKGIRILSNLNLYVFVLLALFIFVFGSTGFILRFGKEGLIDYVSNFLPRSIGINMDKEWSDDWTSFYWANWLAWTPITAIFLGRIGVGYTVREFIQVNLLYTSLFSIVWMMIFSGESIHLDHVNQNSDLYRTLQAQGPENVMFAVFEHLPLTSFTGISFIAASFISYVTGADSNTSVMGALCTTNISPDSPESPTWIKVIWGVLIGFIAWVMVANAGIDGIRMTSNLGGFPALFLMLAVSLGAIRLLWEPDRFLRKK